MICPYSSHHTVRVSKEYCVKFINKGATKITDTFSKISARWVKTAWWWEVTHWRGWNMPHRELDWTVSRLWFWNNLKKKLICDCYIKSFSSALLTRSKLLCNFSKNYFAKSQQLHYQGSETALKWNRDPRIVWSDWMLSECKFRHSSPYFSKHDNVKVAYCELRSITWGVEWIQQHAQCLVSIRWSNSPYLCGLPNDGSLEK